ncbi:hypothetical protein GPM19_05925 [Halomonas sp. ZH2S]|uniref:Uncharacterized protein n=1 Tax=Vreelandella zhuhanensis TaxID=2684210 RepID=A0A7X3KPU6_9GAMM|nr:hypothetical protein [Halomonas zhuhanensis]MWJ27750.1 hypothetical protein [Halomonas zhuhanensis]
MQSISFFDSVGEKIGEIIRAFVDFLVAMFSNFFGAMDAFVDGLTRSLGINASFFSIAVLVIGLLIVFGGIRALLRGSVVGGVLRTLVGLVILSWLIP